jgi:phosphoribosylglycinamide formyltransferase-1
LTRHTGSAARAIVVLISGRGSNMRNLVERSRAAHSPYEVAAVISDKEDAAGLDAARELAVPARCVPAAAPGAAYDGRLAAAIDEYRPALVVLAGFMRILSPGFVDRYAGRMVNIHPSLLPKYPGLHTHRQVLAGGDSRHGATVHFVSAELDAGPRIVQAAVPVLPGDDETSLAARVLEREHRIYPLAVRWYCEGRLICRDGSAWLDGAALAAPLLYDDLIDTE